VCNTTGDKWQPLKQCDAASLCTAKVPPACQDAPPCVEGQRRCRGAEFQTCDSTTSKFKTLVTCPSEALCSTQGDSCANAPCGDGEVRCSGHELQTCTSGAWALTVACTPDQFCSPDLKGCEACGEGACLGIHHYTCALDTKLWSLTSTCGPLSECTPDGCAGPPSCDAGQPCP
jgi:hypothetical protein